MDEGLNATIYYSFAGSGPEYRYFQIDRYD
jgi:hypothetical protein